MRHHYNFIIAEFYALCIIPNCLQIINQAESDVWTRLVFAWKVIYVCVQIWENPPGNISISKYGATPNTCTAGYS